MLQQDAGRQPESRIPPFFTPLSGTPAHSRPTPRNKHPPIRPRLITTPEPQLMSNQRGQREANIHAKNEHDDRLFDRRQINTFLAFQLQRAVSVTTHACLITLSGTARFDIKLRQCRQPWSSRYSLVFIPSSTSISLDHDHPLYVGTSPLQAKSPVLPR